MIRGFGDRLSEDLFEGRRTGRARRFPADLWRAARRKLLYLHEAEDLADLRALPGNRLEGLRGDMRGVWSIRINDPWRVVFRWEAGHASDVRVMDYHG
ncbi:MAG: type II toxin-antitoxin system RelE/ParE family toxin [Planctomycetes bacterium]|nr:type II toxin-antitoxin system RelE/ParE family toxin [Planctomycetota bacterium]